MNGPHSNIIRVRHILDAISEVEKYIDGVSEEEFLNNSEKRFATIKQIEISGEACNRITNEVRDAHPEIPGAQVIGFRNISIHDYHNVSFHIVWNIASVDLPTLKIQMQNLSEELK